MWGSLSGVSAGSRSRPDHPALMPLIISINGVGVVMTTGVLMLMGQDHFTKQTFNYPRPLLSLLSTTHKEGELLLEKG